MKKLLSSLAVVTLIGVTSISVVTCGGERPSPVEKTDLNTVIIKKEWEVPKKVGRWITIKINSFQNYHFKMMIDKLNSLLPLNLYSTYFKKYRFYKIK